MKSHSEQPPKEDKRESFLVKLRKGFQKKSTLFTLGVLGVAGGLSAKNTGTGNAEDVFRNTRGTPSEYKGDIPELLPMAEFGVDTIKPRIDHSNSKKNERYQKVLEMASIYEKNIIFKNRVDDWQKAKEKLIASGSSISGLNDIFDIFNNSQDKESSVELQNYAAGVFIRLAKEGRAEGGLGQKDIEVYIQGELNDFEWVLNTFNAEFEYKKFQIILDEITLGEFKSFKEIDDFKKKYAEDLALMPVARKKEITDVIILATNKIIAAEQMKKENFIKPEIQAEQVMPEEEFNNLKKDVQLGGMISSVQDKKLSQYQRDELIILAPAQAQKLSQKPNNKMANDAFPDFKNPKDSNDDVYGNGQRGGEVKKSKKGTIETGGKRKESLQEKNRKIKRNWNNLRSELSGIHGGIAVLQYQMIPSDLVGDPAEAARWLLQYNHNTVQEVTDMILNDLENHLGDEWDDEAGAEYSPEIFKFVNKIATDPYINTNNLRAQYGSGTFPTGTPGAGGGTKYAFQKETTTKETTIGTTKLGKENTTTSEGTFELYQDVDWTILKSDNHQEKRAQYPGMYGFLTTKMSIEAPTKFNQHIFEHGGKKTPKELGDFLEYNMKYASNYWIARYAAAHHFCVSGIPTERGRGISATKIRENIQNAIQALQSGDSNAMAQAEAYGIGFTYIRGGVFRNNNGFDTNGNLIRDDQNVVTGGEWVVQYVHPSSSERDDMFKTTCKNALANVLSPQVGGLYGLIITNDKNRVDSIPITERITQQAPPIPPEYYPVYLPPPPSQGVPGKYITFQMNWGIERIYVPIDFTPFCIKGDKKVIYVEPRPQKYTPRTETRDPEKRILGNGESTGGRPGPQPSNPWIQGNGESGSKNTKSRFNTGNGESGSGTNTTGSGESGSGNNTQGGGVNQGGVQKGQEGNRPTTQPNTRTGGKFNKQ